MPKTYNTIPTVSTGDVYTATAHNNIVTNVNNYRVAPIARVLLTSDVSIANGNWTSFAGFTSTNASEDIDTDGMVSLSGTASGITIQTAGVYTVSCTVIFASNATANRGLRIVRDAGGAGTYTSLAGAVLNGSANNGNWVQSASGMASLAANDVVRLSVYQNSGGALNLLAVDSNAQFAQTQLAVAWLGQVS
jgi:hypothetical protein